MREGVAFSTDELTYTGAGTGTAATLLVTFCAVNDAACPPADVCSGFEEGFVYATVTVLPLATAPERVSSTFVPETETELTDLAAEFTVTANAEAAGTILASERL